MPIDTDKWIETREYKKSKKKLGNRLLVLMVLLAVFTYLGGLGW